MGEIAPRLASLSEWLHATPATSEIIDSLLQSVEVESLVEGCDRRTMPQAGSPAEIAAVGIYFLEQCQSGTEPYKIAMAHGIRPAYSTNEVHAYVEAMLERFIEPALDHIEEQLEDQQALPPDALTLPAYSEYPLAITESLAKFRADHPIAERAAFIMMQFGTTAAHSQIVAAITATLGQYGIAALRADDKEYHEDLFPNVQTYLHGCGFGIAVFERLEADDFNPNVSLEVGYMRALRKPVCLLKDLTLKTLQTDLVGKLYRSFDPQAPQDTAPAELEAWLRDKDIITR